MFRKLIAASAFLSLATFALAGGELRHVVIFKFRKEATPEQIAGIEKAFAGLPDKIDTITSFEWGTNVSKEKKSKGFTHCFLVTFKDQAGLDAYLPHAAHKEFVSKLGGVLDEAFVFDYVAQ